MPKIKILKIKVFEKNAVNMHDNLQKSKRGQKCSMQ